MSIYDNETKIYPDLNPTAPEEPQTYRSKRLSEIEAFFFDEIDAVSELPKKNESIQYDYRFRRHRSNHITRNHWRNIYCSICQWRLVACWYCLRWN